MKATCLQLTTRNPAADTRYPLNEVGACGCGLKSTVQVLLKNNYALFHFTWDMGYRYMGFCFVRFSARGVRSSKTQKRPCQKLFTQKMRGGGPVNPPFVFVLIVFWLLLCKRTRLLMGWSSKTP
jgi:hypothetical protein